MYNHRNVLMSELKPTASYLNHFVEKRKEYFLMTNIIQYAYLNIIFRENIIKL